jgi:hypothetical protein
MGGLEGITGFDVTDCDGCSTGSNISNGLTEEQETAMLATGATATVPFAGGDATLTYSNGNVAVLDPDGSVQTAYNTTTGAGLLADLNLETVTVSAGKVSAVGNDLVSQISQQITQAVNAAQAQMQTSLLVAAAFSEEVGLAAESSAKVVGPAVAKSLSTLAAGVTAGYDYATGKDRYIVAGDIVVGVSALTLAFPEDVLLGAGWLGLKNYPGGPVGYAQDFNTGCSSSPEVCGN